MKRPRFWPGTPAPSGLPEPVWIVWVTGLPAEGRDWTPRELGDLQEEYGEDEEYLDAAGPEPGYTPEFRYGPYTRPQAEKLAEWLNRPEVAAREKIGGAVAAAMCRYVPVGRYDAPRGES